MFIVTVILVFPLSFLFAYGGSYLGTGFMQERLKPGAVKKFLGIVLFGLGIFITIMVVGLVCTVAGRMLGDVGPWWQSAVGILFLWVAWTLFRPPQCSATGNALSRFRMQGTLGAFILGLGYGFLSGACTFGFIAPILGVSTLQKEIVTGVAMLVLFGVGHCIPLVVCGMFSARTMQLLNGHTGQKVVMVMRKIAALVVGGLGIYFTLNPFMG